MKLFGESLKCDIVDISHKKLSIKYKTRFFFTFSFIFYGAKRSKPLIFYVKRNKLFDPLSNIFYGFSQCMSLQVFNFPRSNFKRLLFPICYPNSFEFWFRTIKISSKHPNKYQNLLIYSLSIDWCFSCHLIFLLEKFPMIFNDNKTTLT